MVKGWQILLDARVQLSHLLSFLPRGNDVSKPLDSSFRWNDGGAAVRRLSGIAKGLSGWQPTCSLPVVIPAKAGIQEGEAGR